jgi:hypothetical protein
VATGGPVCCAVVHLLVFFLAQSLTPLRR